MGCKGVLAARDGRHRLPGLGGRNWQGAEGVERGQELNTVPLLWAVNVPLALSILSVSVFPTILPVLKMRLESVK